MSEIDLSNVISSLKHGNVVVYPTDTLYALGADVFNESAVKKIFNLKQRPLHVSLPVAVSNIKDIHRIAKITSLSEFLINRFLPGKLTLIMQKKPIVPDIVTGGLTTVAVRIPDNIIALQLLSKFGPLTVTSANIHRQKTAQVIKEIQMQFTEKTIAYYLDDGKLQNTPSTIVDVTGEKPLILREGAIQKKEIIGVIKDE